MSQASNARARMVEKGVGIPTNEALLSALIHERAYLVFRTNPRLEVRYHLPYATTKANVYWGFEDGSVLRFSYHLWRLYITDGLLEASRRNWPNLWKAFSC